LLLLLNVVFISRRVRGLSFSSFTKGNWIRFWKGFDDGLSWINGSSNCFRWIWIGWFFFRIVTVFKWIKEKIKLIDTGF